APARGLCGGEARGHAKRRGKLARVAAEIARPPGNPVPVGALSLCTKAGRGFSHASDLRGPAPKVHGMRVLRGSCKSPPVEANAMTAEKILTTSRSRSLGTVSDRVVARLEIGKRIIISCGLCL